MRVYLLKINYDNDEFIKREIQNVGVDRAVELAFLRKNLTYTIKISKLKASWANILKQELLSIGSDLAVSKDTYRCKNEYTDALMTITRQQYDLLIIKLQKQGFLNELSSALLSIFTQSHIWTTRKKDFNLKNDVVIIGILNSTPDSFSDGGLYNSTDKAIKHVETLIKDGANIIDIGGESTRPGATTISVQEELGRIYNIVEKIHREFDIPISIDTYKPEVIENLLEYIDIYNDISSGKNTIKLQETLAKHKIASIIMLNKSSDFKGTAEFEDLSSPIEDFIRFAEQTESKLSALDPKSLVFDPGIGFSWSLANTLDIMSINFSSLPFKTLLGISRKSFLGKIFNIDMDNRDTATAILTHKLIQNGARIFRTHNVKASMVAKKLALSSL